MDSPSTDNPTGHLRFRWPWRPHQERVLDAIEAHLDDKRLHIVAAPGAGKTILGLEVFRRLAQPAVVLAPTRTIRDQWVQRLRDFSPDVSAHTPEMAAPVDAPAWTSRSLDSPRFLTALTYQALHTRHRAQEPRRHDEETIPSETDDSRGEALSRGAITQDELADVVSIFKQVGVRTLILDEAHHLRAAWWKALIHLIEALDDVTVVALTATPPYDVTGTEWKRYEQLCGPIDEEISVPELVRSGTLCAHQDFVWAVAPQPEEHVSIATYDEHVSTITSELQVDPLFCRAVRNHAWITDESLDPATVLDEPALGVALLVFLQAIGDELPVHLLDLFDAAAEQFPELDRHWWQILLKGYLFYEHGWPAEADIDVHRDALKKRLRRLRLLERRTLHLEESRVVESHLALSASKIQACVDIHVLERRVRGDALRQAILTDYIREGEAHRLGAWSVFQALVQAQDAHAPSLALLTGRRVIVHQVHLDRLRQVLGKRASRLSVREAKGMDGYVALEMARGGAALVSPLTQLLREGFIQTIVGTRALLGEGWDAPALNSLILASYVGSYMLTNQMRGRVLRKATHGEDKVASIWHIVALDLQTPSGYRDLEQLKRRFETFVGLSADGHRIENGLERLQLPLLIEPRDLTLWQEEASHRLGDLDSIGQHWQQAVHRDANARLLPTAELRMPKPPTIRSYVFAKTLRYFLYSAFAAFMGIFSQGLELLRQTDGGREAQWILIGASVLGLLYAVPHLWRWLRIALRHVPIDGTLREIGFVVRDALVEQGVMDSPSHKLSVETQEIHPGVWSLTLRGGTFYEKSLFTDALAEVLEPIENPRYVLTRQGSSAYQRRVDYHAVPSVLASNKSSAQGFAEVWRRRIGPTELIYTRSPEGRKVLLQGRMRALSEAFEPIVRRRDRWH